MEGAGVSDEFVRAFDIVAVNNMQDNFYSLSAAAAAATSKDASIESGIYVVKFGHAVKYEGDAKQLQEVREWRRGREAQSNRYINPRPPLVDRKESVFAVL